MRTVLLYITLLFIAQSMCAKPLPKESLMISLPQPTYKGTCSVEEALKGRRSIRSYKKESLSLADVSQLLWAAYGVTEKISGISDGLKTAPSAGATYPLELHLVAGDVTGLPDGIYRYLPEKHALEKMVDGDKRASLCSAAHGQDMISEAPASIVYSAVYERTTGRYGSRGRDRYVYMDLGHSAQNVYLQAYALGMGTCAVGAFDDEAVKKVVPLSRGAVPLYIMPVGKI